MNKETVDGFMLGLGVGILIGFFIKASDRLTASIRDREPGAAVGIKKRDGASSGQPTAPGSQFTYRRALEL